MHERSEVSLKFAKASKKFNHISNLVKRSWYFWHFKFQDMENVQNCLFTAFKFFCFVNFQAVQILDIPSDLNRKTVIHKMHINNGLKKTQRKMAKADN